jgi:probable F420-dependent oxidoreductase
VLIAPQNATREDAARRAGVWGAQLRTADPGEICDAAAELEELGFGAIWIPGGLETDERIFADVARLLAATQSIVVATAIVNIWFHTPSAVAAAYRALESSHPGRFLLGLGIGHRPLLESVEPGRYDQPFAMMQRYLDDLDAQTKPIPTDRRLIAALGPKMLDVARNRAGGSHPYIVPTAHTRFARAALGAGPLLTLGLPVILESDAARARRLARAFLATPYSTLPNYRNAWLRHGFDESDLADGGSDALIDALVAWGDEEAVAAFISDHQAAGADHVCIHVVAEDRQRLPRDEWRRLAATLL